MNNTIESMYRYLIGYLQKLLENVPDNRLYELQLEGYNSAGWLVGHIHVEAQDVFDYLNVSYTNNEEWNGWFRNTTGKIESLEGLPTKADLFNALLPRYEKLLEVYLSLTDEQRTSKHPTKPADDPLSDIDAWIAYHLTSHIAVHCGNIVVWKKNLKLPVIVK